MEPTTDAHLALKLHAGLSALIALFVLVVWGLTGQGEFWPGWVWAGLGLPLGIHAGVTRAVHRTPPGRQRALAVHASVYVVLSAFLTLIWLLSGSDSFWPVWPILGLSAALAAHLLIDRLAAGERE